MGVSGGEDGYVIEGVGIMGESFEGRVMWVVKDGIEEHGMGFELCTIGAGEVCGNTTVG